MTQPGEGAAGRAAPQSAASTSFGTLLRRLRMQAGLTQEQLAERSGLSARAVGDLERASGRRPRMETISLLAQALGLDDAARRAVLAAAYPEAGSDASNVAEPPLGAPSSGSLNMTGAAPQPTPTTLFEPLTALLGREREEAALLHLLAQARLLTLTGPGGVGKTRLALRVAALARTRYAAVHVLALAAVREPALVLPTIATALAVPERTAGTLIEALAAAVSGGPTLLVLDNLEQVRQAGPEVGALLGACPTLTVLATSRAPLRVRGEQEFAVEPLRLPPEGARLETIAQSAAVQLFVQAARGVRASFVLDEEAGPVVGAICRRLDGLPLAIELAAARTRMLSMRVLDERLERRLEVLGAGPLDLPARQQTMRATIAWSYELLEEGERALFRRLGVFAGGGSLEAVRTVCAEEHEGAIEQWLERLLEQSLVMVEEGAGGETRVRLLETIREYAWEQAEERGEAEALRQAHAHHYLGLVESTEMGSAHDHLWMEWMERDHDNLRAALAWALATGQVGLSLRLAAGLGSFWYVRCYLVEGRRWLEAALSVDSGGDLSRDVGGGLSLGAVRAKVLERASVTAFRQGDYEGARAFGTHSVALSEELGDQRRVAAALLILGSIEHDSGDHKQAVAQWERSLDLFRNLQDEHGVGVALNNLGIAALDTGEPARARVLLEESLTYKRRASHIRGIATSLNNLGRAFLLQGETERAHAMFKESLTLLGIDGDRALIADNLEYLGQLLVREGWYSRAAGLFGTAEALREAIGAPRTLSEQPAYEAAVVETRQALGLALSAAWVAGRALPLEQAVERALTVVSGDTP